MTTQPQAAPQSAPPPAAARPDPDVAKLVVDHALKQRCEDLQLRVSALEEQLQSAEQKLMREHWNRVKLEGNPRAFPDNIEPRYTSEPLRQAVAQALQEAGFKADITAVDCEEYPCVVFGSGFGAPGDVMRLKKANAFRIYAEDAVPVFSWRHPDKNVKSRFFGISVMPAGEPQPLDASRRLRYRAEAMWEGFLGGK